MTFAYRTCYANCWI